MSNAIIIERIRAVTIVRFNRPAERNPLSIPVLESLHRIVGDCLGKESGQIVFTGAGDIFASGADLREIALVTGETARDFALRGQTLMAKIAACESVAAVNGLCFGGAFDLALACRKRFATPSAVFSHPGGNLGIMTGWGGTQRLPKLVGEALALDMFLTARRVEASEALRVGLIDEIADDPVGFALRSFRAQEFQTARDN